MAGRNRTFDEYQCLEKAKEVFWTKGYEATTLDDLLHAMELRKSSFYNSFVSKEHVFLRTMRLHDKTSFDSFRMMLKASDNGIDVLKFLFFQFADASKSEHMRGCYAGNVIVELNANHPKMTNGAKKYLLQLEQVFFEIIEDGKKSKNLKTEEDSRLLAQTLITLWNGINITRRVHNNKEELRKLIAFQLKIIY